MWGAGGIGKTTLMTNPNNELRQIGVSRPKLCFGVVVWIRMPKPTNVSKVQALIAKRLSLVVDNEGSEESNACKIYKTLKEEKSFLVILDDVWERRCAPTQRSPRKQGHYNFSFFGCL